MSGYELLVCERCGREKVRPTELAHMVRCFCGSEDYELFDLVAVERDPDERYEIAEEVSRDAVAA